MPDALFYLFWLAVFLVIWVAVGHGLWVLAAMFLRAAFGNQEEQARRCPHCGRMSVVQGRCQNCTPDAKQFGTGDQRDQGERWMKSNRFTKNTRSNNIALEDVYHYKVNEYAHGN